MGGGNSKQAPTLSWPQKRHFREGQDNFESVSEKAYESMDEKERATLQKYTLLLSNGESIARYGFLPDEYVLERVRAQEESERKQKEEQEAAERLRILKGLPPAVPGGNSFTYVVGSGQSAYRGAAEYYGARAGISGAGSSEAGVFYGGDELDMAVVKEYASTLNSFAKQALINDLMTAMKDLGFKLAGETVEAQLKDLNLKIPNSKRNGKSFKSDAASQAVVCSKLAQVINNNIGKEVINPKEDPSLICQQVSELVYSLNVGMQTEFLAVQENLRKVIKNLHLLREQQRLVVDPLVEGIQNGSDSKLRIKAAKNLGLFKLISEETERQLALLQNLVSVTLSPAEVKLTTLIRESDDLVGVIEKLETKPGDSQFGDLLSKVITNVGVTAEYALIVDNALKAVGMSISEYANSPSLRALAVKVSDGIMKREMTDAQLYDFMQSAELLYKNYYRSKDIEKLLSKQGSSEGNMSNSFLDIYNSLDSAEGAAEGGDDDMFDGVSGGNTFDEREFKKTLLDKRIEMKSSVRTLIFKTFTKTVDEHMYKIVVSLNNIASKLGRNIKLSDELDGFRNAIQKLRPLLNKQNTYLALLGYYGDALSRERREMFVGQLSLIKSYADSLAQSQMYAHMADGFRDVSAAIGGLKSTIDQYSDKIAQKYGAGDEDDGADFEALGAGEDGEDGEAPGPDGAGCLSLDGVSGGNADVSGGSLASDYLRSNPSAWKPDVEGPLRKVPRSLNDAITKFDYYVKVAQIRDNLANSAKEIDHYSENYETIRAEAIAKKIDGVKETYKGLLDALDTKAVEKSGKQVTGAELYVLNQAPAPAGRTSAPVGGLSDPEREELKAKTARTVEEMSRVRQNFWRTVEAVDEYMRVFTNDMIKNPDSLQNIKAILDETEVIYDWYTAKTGQLICLVFDSFPAVVTVGANNGAVPPVYTGDATVAPTKEAIWGEQATSSHYYAEMAKVNAVADLPGNCYLALKADDIDHGYSGFTKMKKVTRNLNLLKNILSVFIHVGSTFSDQPVYKKVFMTPTQIFKNLSEWLEICSFGMGGGTTVSGTDQEFLNKYGIYMRGRNGGTELFGGMEEEDKMFTVLIKSMCAKVLTIVGLYDVLSRPDETITYGQVRYMIGGSSDPVVEERAAELYIRLPLLAEFYRELFNFHSLDVNPAGSDFIAHPNRPSRSEKIAMLPEVEGPFSGLIRLVFQKAKGFTLTDYSDVELKELVGEVNLIWTRLSGAGGENAVNHIIREFINEVNMRYGIISERERNLYEREFGYKLQYPDHTVNSERDLDIPLLPGEEDIEFERDSIAPSKKYEQGSSDALKSKKSPYFITAEHRVLVNRLRCALDSYFHENGKSNATPMANYGNPGNDGYKINSNMVVEHNSLRPAVKEARLKLRVEQNAANRFKIVSSMIRGAKLLTKSDHVKYALFHETIVTGLNTLSAVYTLLVKYQALVLSTELDLWEKTLDDAIAARPAAVLTAAGIITANAFAGLVKTKLEAEYYKNDQQKLVGQPDLELFMIDIPALANRNKADAVNALAKKHLIAQRLIEGVYSVGRDLQGLVSINIESDRIVVNFGRLKEQVLGLMDSIAYFVEALRPSVSLDDKTLERYTAKMRVGSLYWLRENLVDKLLEGRQGFKNASDNTMNRVDYISVDHLNRKLNSTLKRLNTGGFAWGQLLARELFYDSQIDANSGLQGIGPTAVNESRYTPVPTIAGATVALGIDFTTPMNKLLMLNQGAKQIVYPKYSNRFHQLYSWNDNVWSNNSSLLFAFNQLLAKYVSVCYDTSAEKIYMNTISNVVNGILNNGIMNPNNTFPDYVPDGTRVEMRGNKGGPVDPISIELMANISRLNAIPPRDFVAEAVNALLRLNNATAAGVPVFVPALAGGATIQRDAADMKQLLITNNIEIPQFLSALINAYGNNNLPNLASAKDAAKGFFDAYTKNVNSFVLRSDDSVNGEIPTPLSVTGDGNNASNSFGRRTDPNHNNILYTTLAVILRNIITSKNSTNQTMIYTLDNIAEVSQFKKESLRAHLPSFRGMFKELQNKAEFLKQLMNTDIVNGKREQYQGNWAAPNTVEGLSTSGGLAPVTDDKAGKKELDNFQMLATNISQACGNVLTCIDNVMRELADTPKYLEVHQNSIAEHKSMYETSPLMPISSALFYLKNSVNTNTYAEKLPINSVGTTGFKLAYGCRGLMNSFHTKVTSDSVPGWTQLIDMYNLLVPARESVDVKKSHEFLESVTTLMRYVHSVRNYKGYLTPDVDNTYTGHSPNVSNNYTESHNGALSRTQFVIERNDTPANPRTGTPLVFADQYGGNRVLYGIVVGDAANVSTRNADSNNPAAYSIQHDISAVVDLTVNADKDKSIERLALHVSGENKTRKDLTVANILDLNIMPINVHALMRDIPLANLYNYSYTFDRLLIELHYGINNDFANLLIWKLCQTNDNPNQVLGTATTNVAGSTVNELIKSPKELFIALMLDPHRQLDALGERFFEDICRGDDNLQLGRPKFLSDQLFNKVLFGKIYHANNSFDRRYNPSNERGGPVGPPNDDYLYQQRLNGRENAPELLSAASSLSSVTVPSNARKVDIDAIGKGRRDTCFIRNLVLMTNAYRSLRLRLRNDLMYNKEVIISSHAVTRDDNTEFRGDQRLLQSSRYSNLSQDPSKNRDSLSL